MKTQTRHETAQDRAAKVSQGRLRKSRLVPYHYGVDAIAHHTRPAPGQVKEDSPRQRLIGAATRLFCKYGINATGIDAIVAEAGTAKTTLYKLFGSKSDLVEAVLEAEGREWRDWFIEAVDSAGSPRAKLDAIFPALKTWFSDDGYYGCAFINAVGEHDKDETRLRSVTLKHKKMVLGHISEIARDAGASDPDGLAHQIGILMDGAIVAAMVTRNPDIADAAASASAALVNNACPAVRSRRKAKSPVRREKPKR